MEAGGRCRLHEARALVSTGRPRPGARPGARAAGSRPVADGRGLAVLAPRGREGGGQPPLAAGARRHAHRERDPRAVLLPRGFPVLPDTYPGRAGCPAAAPFGQGSGLHPRSAGGDRGAAGAAYGARPRALPRGRLALGVGGPRLPREARGPGPPGGPRARALAAAPGGSHAAEPGLLGAAPGAGGAVRAHGRARTRRRECASACKSRACARA
mmetsp:Transcript_70243/g.186677  ORF Transcript_70243/g.186677 Transcript_70243/m.186677 type:complete len:213 (-) Transcript_70243:26-664(-)